MQALDVIREFRSVQSEGRQWSSILALVIVLAIISVCLYGYAPSSTSVFTSCVMLSGASLLVGAFAGFLFGIPRSLQSEVAAPEDNSGPSDGSNGSASPARRPLYRANTNLEQISDWLTKILVGVGLTQMSAIPGHLSDLSKYFGPSLGDVDKGPPIAASVIIFFTVAGFLFSYLWTRLFLGRELALADSKALQAQVREAVDQQGEYDARALSLSHRYLSDHPNGDVDVAALKAAILKASPAVKVQVFYEAQELRSQSWQKPDTRWRIERTIPIFEALAESDVDQRFHRNRGELGFALKDKREPDYLRAEAELTTAIDMRGPASEAGWRSYEYARAGCRVRLDPDFKDGKPSTPEHRDLILTDLKVAAEDFGELSRDPDIARWLEVNQIKSVVPDEVKDKPAQ